MNVSIIGAGLAGSETAWQLAKRGFKVYLYEMKPESFSPAHKMKGFAELVCSNSLRSNDMSNAAGLLKEEMRQLDSIIIKLADETSVPAGKALAVDRQLFSDRATEVLSQHENIEVITEEVKSLGYFISNAKLNQSPLVIATGPLTTEALSRDIANLIGQEYLYFYDSVAPIVDARSIDFSKGFKASRYGYGGADYWNFPISKSEYEEFLLDLALAKKVVPHDFEDPKYFEGCLPIEVMAERGPETLRYGPMKPFGLSDPEGVQPYALIQLRQEDAASTMYNIVGFQTRMTWDEQKRVFRKFPGFKDAKFLRCGVIHRNTYINSPKVLNENLSLNVDGNIFFAGQITGVEGYIESAAVGLWVGLYLSSRFSGFQIDPPPRTTAIGSLVWHVANPGHRNFQPMNVNFGLMPVFDQKIPKKSRKEAILKRASDDFKAWSSLIKPLIF